jgi:hypothetical protein
MIQEIKKQYIYEGNNITQEMLKNKLLCTFVNEERLESFMDNIIHSYNISFNKLFILSSVDNNEFMITYNIDSNKDGSTELSIIDGTVIVHRKKDYNCLYSINALNAIIKEQNNNTLDNTFMINWSLYKNCILLSNEGYLKKIPTKIYKIVNL